MTWLPLVFFIIFMNSANAMTIEDYENKIVKTCIEYTTPTSDLYYCIMSELRGFKKVRQIIMAKHTYTPEQWEYFRTLLDKHFIGNDLFNYVNIELEFRNYLKEFK